MDIRFLEKKYLNEIKNIVNYFITNTNDNLNFDVKTDEDMVIWFDKHAEKDFPVIVYIIDEKVVGFASLYTFRDYKGYDKTTEISLYVKDDYKKMGIGSKLIQEIEKEGIKKGYHSIVSAITNTNIASINLHKKFGYIEKCKFEEIAYKNGECIDVVFLQKIIRKS